MDVTTLDTLDRQAGQLDRTRWTSVDEGTSGAQKSANRWPWADEASAWPTTEATNDPAPAGRIRLSCRPRRTGRSGDSRRRRRSAAHRALGSLCGRGCAISRAGCCADAPLPVDLLEPAVPTERSVPSRCAMTDKMSRDPFAKLPNRFVRSDAMRLRIRSFAFTPKCDG